ncbi:hypothetical protein [Mycolicibacterium sp. PDY-3]|uniref:putative PDDEXK endonuclease n=1 Tax=Mycolicibacterium sp. PDY-3 TaxID=3376069 RepID=UPI0037A21D0B
MSESSEKGVSLENHVAKTLRKKLGARVERDKRSGAGSHRKMDISDFYQDTPFDIEAKNHKTIAVKEWMRQAKAGSSLGRIPTVVFNADDDVLACLPFDALVDMAAEIQQLKAEITDLRTPIVLTPDQAIEKVSETKRIAGAQTCPSGHLVAPGTKKCLDKHCKFSSSYNRKKAAKAKS